MYGKGFALSFLPSEPVTELAVRYGVRLLLALAVLLAGLWLSRWLSHRLDAHMVRLKKAEARVLQEPAPLIVVGELAESAVIFRVRVWTASEDDGPVYFDMQERVKKGFDPVGISIPFPQRDVHMHAAAT